MQNIYRETFEQIHASEQLRKEVANVPKQEKAAFRHHISKAGLIAAALAGGHGPGSGQSHPLVVV